MKFIGRQQECALLNAWDGAESKISVVYGRRRVGKTRLVEEAFQNSTLYKFEGIEGQHSTDSKKEFLNQMIKIFNLSELHGVKTNEWRSLFSILSKCIGTKPCIMFLDEFQWTAGERKDIIGELKFAWDNIFMKNNRVHLVLCGSVSSFIVNNVLRSRALYGRISTEIQLQPLMLPEVIAAFISKRSIREIIELYMVTGGIPQYLKLIDTAKSTLLNIESLCFTKNGFLINELERIFISHFGKNPHYREIIAYLAKNGWADREELQKLCRIETGGRITSYLENLSLAGFIEKFTRLNSNKGMRNTRFRLSDFYLLFYFTFIDPNFHKIQTSVKPLPASHYLPDQKYASWQGVAFERICSAHNQLIAEKLGFGAVRYDTGSWFSSGTSSEKTQIDLMYIRADRVVTLCEIKFSQKPSGREVIKEMQRKVELYPNKKKYSLEKVLICLTPPSKEVVNEGYFNRILTADEIFG